MPTRLAVADLWPEPTHSFVEVGEITGSPLTSFLYIPIPPHTEFGTIHAQLKHLHSPVRRAISGFILRPQAEDVQALLDDQALIERIQHRLDEKPGWVLYWDGTRHNLSPLKSNSKAVTLRPKVVSEIVRVLRRAETSLLLSHPGAVLPNLAELHYEGPNGSHYASFARPGLALRRIARLDAMCFWLQHFLRQPTTVLLDSWSMLSLGLKLQLYCGKNVHHLESLLDYHESTDLILGRLAERNGQLPERILLLLSVSSTGALAKRLHDACRRDGCRDIAVVSLFAAEQFRKSAIGDVFCPLGQEFSPVSRNLCQWCLKGSSIVKIEPTTYLMEISATAKETRITKNGAKQARDFLVGYGGIDYLSVHRNQHDQARHHMIHVDISKILTSRRFQQRLRVAAAQLRSKIDLILAPNHFAARELAEQVRKALGITGERLLLADDTALQYLGTQAKQAIKKSKGLLIVDDVVITGDRFWSYRNALERAGLTAPQRPVHFLVGLERTPTKETLQGVCDAAHSVEHFHPIESLTLPNWGDDECPWCWEFAQLKKHGEQLGGSVQMKARFNSLRRTNEGISKNLFLHWDDSGARPHQLGPQSQVFGPLQREIEVFVAVASVLQSLRSAHELSEQVTPPAARILEPELTFIGRYYASIVTASVLRAARRHDLRSTTSDARLVRGIGRRLRTQRVTELRSEMLFAMARGILPLVDGVVNDPLFVAAAEQGVGQFLHRLLQQGKGVISQSRSDPTFAVPASARAGKKSGRP